MEKKAQTIDLAKIRQRVDARGETNALAQQSSIGIETARAKIEQALSLSESLLLEIAELMTMANRFIDEAVSDKDINTRLTAARELLSEASHCENSSVGMSAAFLSAMIGVLLNRERQVRSPLVIASIIVSEIERLKRGAN